MGFAGRRGKSKIFSQKIDSSTGIEPSPGSDNKTTDRFAQSAKKASPPRVTKDFCFFLFFHYLISLTDFAFFKKSSPSLLTNAALCGILYLTIKLNVK